MRVKLVRSLIQREASQVATAKALGLRRIGDEVTVRDIPDQLGLVNKIKFLLEVIPDTDTVPVAAGEGVAK